MAILNQAIRRTLLRLESAVALTDGALLARFVAAGEQAVFEELVRRHGSMVLRVCRRVLQHAQDAEDAFQATFIVLARKAKAIAKQESVASWLHGVAYRVALKARASASQRRAREKLGAVLLHNNLTAPTAFDRTELRTVLDEEIGRLPAKYRATMVLYYFEGKTSEEAASLLRCQTDAIKKRLSRARDLLRSQLARRNLTLSVCALVTLLAQEGATAALPVALVSATVRSGAVQAAGKAANTVTTPAGALANAMLQSQFWAKVKVYVGVAAAVALVMVAMRVALVGEAVQSRSGLAASRVSVEPPSERLTIQGSKGMQYLAFTPDSRRLLWANGDGLVKVWDAATGKELAGFTGRPNPPAVPIAFAPDGQSVALASNTTIYLHDVNSGVVRASWKGTDRVSALAFSPHGQMLAVVGRPQPDKPQSRLQLWDVAARQVRTTMQGHHAGEINCVAFASNGQTIASGGSTDATVMLWNAHSGERQASFHRPGGGRCWGIGFSPDGKSLATGWMNGGLASWDQATKKETRLGFPSSEPNLVTAVAFAPDGQTLASARISGDARAVKHLTFRDVATGQERVALSTHRHWIIVLAFAPDGRSLASADSNGTIKLWNVGVVP
jgi:RNA polymerase sigma factor (sigma-70 family)